MSDVALEGQVTRPQERSAGFGGWLRNPWRKPWFLAGFTWAYLAWSILPVLIAIAFSFNAGRSRSVWQGFSMRWWTGDPNDALFHDPALRQAIVQSLRLSFITMIIAVPLGTMFAIALDRWHGRPARTANFGMLFSFVMPEIILGVALYLLFTNLFKQARAPRDGRPAAGPDHVPAVVSGDHRARAIAHDRARVRGGRDGPRREAGAGAPPGAAAAVVPGDLRELRDHVRRHDRRLRDRELPVFDRRRRSRCR